MRIGLGLLGLSADGHTASLFGAPDLERARGRSAVRCSVRTAWRRWRDPGTLATVKEPLFVVAGAGKPAAVRALLAQDQLTAWHAVQGCTDVELWLTQDEVRV